MMEGWWAEFFVIFWSSTASAFAGERAWNGKNHTVRDIIGVPGKGPMCGRRVTVHGFRLTQP